MQDSNQDVSIVEKATAFIIKKCAEEGIVVHRYDAKTSNSVYLKFDFGLAHSLRISDHKGIEKYHYRYNLIQGQPKPVTVAYKNKCHSYYYPMRDIYDCVQNIIESRKEIIETKYEGIEAYKAKMDKTRQQIERLPREKLYPFWKYGRRMV